jgi:hypothetical protein
MKVSLLSVLILLTVFSAGGKKIRYVTKYEKRTVFTEHELNNEECLLASIVVLSTEEKVTFDEKASNATGSVSLTGRYYTDCTPSGANLMEFAYNVTDVIDGTKRSNGGLTLPSLNGLNNATLYLSANMMVRTSTCTVEYILDDDGEYSRYDCTLQAEDPAVPFSLNYSLVTYRGVSLWQEASIERGLGFVTKNEEISRCQEEKVSNLDLTFGSSAIVIRGRMNTPVNRICMSKNGSSDKFTWIPQ